MSRTRASLGAAAEKRTKSKRARRQDDKDLRAAVSAMEADVAAAAQEAAAEAVNEASFEGFQERIRRASGETAVVYVAGTGGRHYECPGGCFEG